LVRNFIAAVFTNAVPLDMTSHSSSSLTVRSAMPINYNPNEWNPTTRLVKKRRGLTTLDLSDSELNQSSTARNRIMAKRNPIYYNVDETEKDPVTHIKRVQKKSRRSIVRRDNDKKIKRNEK